jgi:hypothetical protein
VGEEEPEAKDRFGQYVKYGVSNDFGVQADDASTIGNTPDAKKIVSGWRSFSTRKRVTYTG